MGWFDNVMAVVNPITYVTSGGSEVSKYVPGNTPANGGASYLSGTGAADREKDLEAGYAKGKEIFYDDPDMKNLRVRREDLAKGYSGEELGALRSTARGEIAGQRNADQSKLSSNLAKGGVGGARSAAIRGAVDQKYAGQTADAERKMALDSAIMVRSGTNDLQDFIFRQKYGQLGTGISYGQMGVSDRGYAAQIAANNKKEDKGVVGQILDSFF